MQDRCYHPNAGPNWRLILGAVFLLATIAETAQAGPGSLGAVLKQLGYEQIELRRTGENHLFLFGQVNGRRRSCLVDTGWSLTTMSTNTAQRLATPGVVDDLRLGRVTLTNVPAVVQDLRVNGQPTAFDLVLGCDFLMRHHTVIDCGERRLYLRRDALAAGWVDQLSTALRQRGLRPVEMTRQNPLAITCTAKVNGRDVELLVDTGAMWSCLDTETARAMELRAVPSANQIAGAAAAGKRGVAVARVNTFAMGGWETANVNFAVLNLADWGLGTNGPGLNFVGGILGGDQLLSGAAVIDCGQLKLWQRGRE